MSRLWMTTMLALAACASEPPVPRVAPAAPPSVAVAETPPPPAPQTAEAPDETAEAQPDEPELRLTPSGLGIVEVRLGDGAEAAGGRRVVVHYVGHLTDGSEFDSSRSRGTPFEFELGAGMVIAGWDEGVEGMRVGGVRKLIIPPDLGYGSRGAPPKIPPDAVLEFVIELLEVR